MPILRGFGESYGLAQRKALIRYYFREKPSDTIDGFSEQWGQLVYALTFDGKIKQRVSNKG